MYLYSLILAFGFTGPEDIYFEQQARGILKAYCFECHGETEKLKGGLDLRLKKFMISGGENGPAIITGNSRESILIKRIESNEMPPGKKKLEPEQISILKRWIDSGAKTEFKEPETLPRGNIITAQDRQHWSLKPIIRPPIPQVQSTLLVKTPIDAFLLKKLEEKKLGFSPIAEKSVLLRRLYFDVLGTPPPAEQMELFLKDHSPDAFAKMVERVLASPHYGERWARHWMDVAGYADSEGYDGTDVLRKTTYHYRDYLIRSLNSNKPWNQLIQEQLAGDEMVRPPYEKLPNQELDKLIATGFLRLAPDGSSGKDVDLKVSSNQTVADTIQIVSGALLGLTVHCAQCHNHRYDPISQTDYFRMRSVFEPALNPKQWKGIEGREVKIQYPEEKKKSDDLEKQASEIDARRTVRFNEVQKQEFEKSLDKVPQEKHAEIKKAFDTPLVKRSAEQKKLLSDYPNSNVNTGLIIQRNAKLNAEFKKYTDEAANIRSKKPPVTSYRVLAETVEKPPQTFRFERGDVDQPKEVVDPGHFEVFHDLNLPAIPVDDPSLPSTGRRLAFAKAITGGKFPMTSRVLVNRFWMHHFGRPIAGSPSDFGKLGEAPSHPELLDWLASEFLVNWDLKSFHRLVLLSHAYQQQSVRSDNLQAIDPDNHLLGRMNSKRLEGEIIRDAMLSVSGKLNTRFFGPPVPVTPDDYGQIVIGADTRDAAGRFTGKKVGLNGEEFRRSIYIQSRRSAPLAVFESFDAPLANPSCDHRNKSTSPTQSLLMLNSQFIQEQAGNFANRLLGNQANTDSEKIELAWFTAFGVAPSSEEMKESISFISEQKKVFDNKVKSDKSMEQQVWTTFCQGLLISNRFLYVD